MSALGQRLDQLREIAGVQALPGNWQLSAYNHGLANGLELALAIMSGRPPTYLKEPAEGYKGLPASALHSKAVPAGDKLGGDTPAAETAREIVAAAEPAPISPEKLGSIPSNPVKKPEPDDHETHVKLHGEMRQTMNKEKETMAKKPKPAPKKPTAPARGAKAKPIAKAKAKSPKKASFKKGAVKRAAKRVAKARKR